MTKEEIIARIEEQEDVLGKLKFSLEDFRKEKLFRTKTGDSPLSFLLVGVDYLKINLNSIKQRVRMS